jgi:hypothetical protein
MTGCGGSSGPTQKPADYLSDLPAGYRYVKLSKTAEQRERLQFDQNQVREVLVRQVERDGKVAAAVVVVLLRQSSDTDRVAKGFIETAGGEARAVTLQGKKAREVEGRGFVAVFDSDRRIFLSIVGHDRSELERLAGSIVR